MHKEIAKIKDTMLGIEDHGIFTVMLHVDYGGSAQGVGGHALDEPVRENGEFLGRFGSGFGAEYIKRVIKACGVRKWEDVKGRTIMVLKDDDSYHAKAVGIGPLPTERGTDFIFEELRQEYFGEDKNGPDTSTD